MEAGGENSGNVNLKRQREPLSDSEDNIFPTPATSDLQKRRRLEAAGRENCSPKPSASGRWVELETKPDTPIVPSVRSRVQLLTQRRDGEFHVAQRCLSDPGVLESKGSGEQLLTEGEFNQRMERFKVPEAQASSNLTPSPARSCPRSRSNFVSDIQQKLQSSTTPSSKQATRIRQEREQELNQTQFQRISENAWLKRSNSDPLLTQAHGDADMKDGSFTEATAADVEKPSGNTVCQGAPSTSEAAELGGSYKQEEPNTPHGSGLSSHDETNTGEIIDQMFNEVLEYAGRVENERRFDDDGVGRDSGVVAGSGNQNNMDAEVETSEVEDECDQDSQLENNVDELLTFPSAGILSPLSKSVEAVVTPLRLAAAQESNPSSLLLSPDETSTPVESAPLYSIDAYRSQRQRKPPTIQSVTPAVQRRAPAKTRARTSVNTKEKIAALNEEAVKLQTVINQTLQALSCCTDEEHGRGSLEEAEAEKLLLVSCEKHSALMAEVTRLREERSSESDEAAREDAEYVSQQPCRGTVRITKIQLPLKVEFVCSSHNRAGRPSHYFFVLIRHGHDNIVATSLATAADALNGDTISFPTAVTLNDIRPSFEIEVEVYSLAHTSAPSCSVDRTTTKSRVTPRKLLNTLTRTNNSLASSAALAANTRRTSNFCLVGSHKITLASLGHSKFPLDKMKFEGKIRRLLGDEFQDKVPFLSPLEGNIYLQLDSESHVNIHHQGFLTMFELISGYGVWYRRYFVLDGCDLYYWNHPNDRETKEAQGSVSLSRSPSQCVRPVKRDSCARPFTFELVNNVTQEQDQSQEAFSKCWFSADTKQERLDWMEKLSQALLDFHTWNRTQSESQPTDASSSGKLRESML